MFKWTQFLFLLTAYLSVRQVIWVSGYQQTYIFDSALIFSSFHFFKRVFFINFIQQLQLLRFCKNPSLMSNSGAILKFVMIEPYNSRTQSLQPQVCHDVSYHCNAMDIQIVHEHFLWWTPRSSSIQILKTLSNLMTFYSCLTEKVQLA